jgi:hypothetical protein
MMRSTVVACLLKPRNTPAPPKLYSVVVPKEVALPGRSLFLCKQRAFDIVL